MDTLLSTMKHDDLLDKHFRLLGPSATSKSIILNTFIKKNHDCYEGVYVPMSAYLNLDKLKKVIEDHYISRRRNQMELADKNKKVVLIIDDLHLHSNLKINFLEFL